MKVVLLLSLAFVFSMDLSIVNKERIIVAITRVITIGISQAHLCQHIVTN